MQRSGDEDETEEMPRSHEEEKAPDEAEEHTSGRG